MDFANPGECLLYKKIVLIGSTVSVRGKPEHPLQFSLVFMDVGAEGESENSRRHLHGKPRSSISAVL